jgi:hypothetical protein
VDTLDLVRRARSTTRRKHERERICGACVRRTQIERSRSVDQRSFVVSCARSAFGRVEQRRCRDLDPDRRRRPARKPTEHLERRRRIHR